MKIKKLAGLLTSDYEHPFDRRALNVLEGTPGFEYAIRKFWEYGIEKMLVIQCTGSNLRVTERNFPDILHLFQAACEAVDMPERPELFIESGPLINAYATGVEKPIVVLNSKSIDWLTPDELLFIMGHELGHIKSNHVLYHHMAQFLPTIGSIIGQATLGIGNLVSMGLQAALLSWQRMSEFTADRAGLLTCQNVEVAAKAMLKLCGLPEKYFDRELVPSFIEQARAFEELDYEKTSKVAKVFCGMSNTHPWTVRRCAEMYRWVDDQGLEQIITTLSRSQELPLPGNAHYCPNCSFTINKGDQFCGGCGKRFVLTEEDTVRSDRTS